MPFFAGTTGRVHYRRWETPGECLAGLMFLHGMGQHTGHYHRFAAALGAIGIETWGIDQAGHGLSEGDPDDPGVLADLAEDAARLTAIAERDRPGLPRALMGHSLGAAVSITLLARESDRFECAVLCGTPKSATGDDGVALLTGLRIPILAVHGIDDRIAPIDPVRGWAAQLSNVELREFENAGHDLLHEKVHRAVTSAVGEFVLAAAVRR